MENLLVLDRPPADATASVPHRSARTRGADWTQRVHETAAWALGSLGALALAGWMSGELVLASVQSRFIPMAPLTAIAFLLLAGALAALPRGRTGAATGASAGAVVAAAGAARLASLIFQHAPLPDVEAALVANAGSFGAVPLARVSPVTAAALLATGTAVVLLATRSLRCANVAGWLSAAVALTGCTVLLGYAYGTPLLYGGTVIPVALPTGAGLALAGIGTMAAAGPGAWPLCAFIGGTARAQLLRAFLPPATAALLAASATGRVLVVYQQVNPALAAALSTLGATVVVAAIVWRIAATVGRAIDQAEEGLTGSRDELEHAVAQRTAELARINQELDAFTSSVSHDLRAPLRHMTGFAALLEQSKDALPAQGQTYVRRIVEAGERMTRLIDDLLAFARTSQAPLRTSRVELSNLMAEVIAESGQDPGGHAIEWRVEPLPAVRADQALLRQALANLVGNAVKYSRTREQPVIEVGTAPPVEGRCVIYVRDNGVGFDMAYADKLFGVFQRLHAADEFEGTGIGLANVRRIVERHGGRVWAEGAVDRGATFFISLPA